MELFMIFFGAIFFNNFVLNRFLGICPFLGVSKRIETSVGMGMAVAFVMTLASVMTWLLRACSSTRWDWVTCRPLFSSWSSRPWSSLWRCSCRRSAPHCTKPWACICP